MAMALLFYVALWFMLVGMGCLWGNLPQSLLSCCFTVSSICCSWIAAVLLLVFWPCARSFFRPSTFRLVLCTCLFAFSTCTCSRVCSYFAIIVLSESHVGLENSILFWSFLEPTIVLSYWFRPALDDVIATGAEMLFNPHLF